MATQGAGGLIRSEIKIHIIKLRTFGDFVLWKCLLVC